MTEFSKGCEVTVVAGNTDLVYNKNNSEKQNVIVLCWKMLAI